MKLIIDIPDNEYKYTCERTFQDRTMWDDAIRNGIPLDDTVLRCRDCKYASIHCTQYDTDVDALDGCSNGERDDL